MRMWKIVFVACPPITGQRSRVDPAHFRATRCVIFLFIYLFQTHVKRCTATGYSAFFARVRENLF